MNPKRCDIVYRAPLALGAEDHDLGAAYLQAAQATIARAQQDPLRPRGLAPFDALLCAGGDAPGGFDTATRGGRPLVGVVCNFAPEELILAAGAFPVRLDLGLGQAASAGGRLLGTDACPEVRALVGAHAARLPGFEQAALIVVPTACDGKKKVARLLAEFRDVFVLELPPGRRSDAGQRLFLEQVHGLRERLEALTQVRVTRGALSAAIDLCNRRSDLCRRLTALRCADPAPISGRDAMLVLQASFVADPRWYCDQLEPLLAELAERVARGEGYGGRTRLLITGSPIFFPDVSVFEVLERASALVVADELCSGTQRLYNKTVRDERTVNGMLRAVADRALLPCTCPCFLSPELRIDRLLTLSQDARVTGVIHHALRLCQLYELDTPRVAAALKQAGLPHLAVHADSFGDGVEMLRNRVEAFLEMLQLYDES